MSSEPNNPSVEAALKLVQLLAPLNPEERDRAIAAAKILLGHPTSATHAPASPPAPGVTLDSGSVSPKASAWMKKYSITQDQIDQVFAVDGGTIEVIASSMPGSSMRQKTVEAYVICGLKSFLQSGDPSFTDKEAREVCMRVGCYDTPNHSNYMKALGNLAAGSKESGWKLSNPGISKAAEIVKDLTQAAHA
jgi:hypothetical protein